MIAIHFEPHTDATGRTCYQTDCDERTEREQEYDMAYGNTTIGHTTHGQLAIGLLIKAVAAFHEQFDPTRYSKPVADSIQRELTELADSLLKAETIRINTRTRTTVDADIDPHKWVKGMKWD